MNRKYFLVLAMLASMFAFFSCGSDDGPSPDNEQVADSVLYAGTISTVVDFNGTPYPCGDTKATAIMVYGKDGRTLVLQPMSFDITVPMMGDMQIATEENLSFQNLKVTQDGLLERFEGEFEGMIATVMRGSSMPMQMKCTVDGSIDTSVNHCPVTFVVNVNQWGSMPFKMQFDFNGEAQL